MMSSAGGWCTFFTLQVKEPLLNPRLSLTAPEHLVTGELNHACLVDFFFQPGSRLIWLPIWGLPCALDKGLEAHRGIFTFKSLFAFCACNILSFDRLSRVARYAQASLVWGLHSLLFPCGKSFLPIHWKKWWWSPTLAPGVEEPGCGLIWVIGPGSRSGSLSLFRNIFKVSQ